MTVALSKPELGQFARDFKAFLAQSCDIRAERVRLPVPALQGDCKRWPACHDAMPGWRMLQLCHFQSDSRSDLRIDLEDELGGESVRH